MKIFVAIVVILLVWSVWGYFSSRVEQAEYTVVEKKNGYEIRKYPAHLVAQTTVEGNYDEALNKGFSIIAGYIFGGNTKKEKVAMTAPVTETRSEKIAMTAPVTAEVGSGTRTIAFVIPKGYTKETLPVPNDPRVKIVEVPEKTMAVLKFSWYRSASRVEEKKFKLLSLLAVDNIKPVGTPLYAGYNAPWTPPWLVRNEIQIEISK